MTKRGKRSARSRAARKGWQTRRKNEKALKELNVDLSTDYETKKAILERYWRIKTLVLKAALRSLSVKDALRLIPPEERDTSIKAIIQHRMDSATRLFGDPRIEAWDLAEELDWDISEVYDAWDYDENAA